MATQLKDKQNLIDHDLLIELRAKVDLLLTGQKENFAALSIQISGQDGRIKALEKLSDEINPVMQVKRINENYDRIVRLEQFVHDFRLTYKTIIAIASGIGGIVGFLISTIVGIWRLKI